MPHVMNGIDSISKRPDGLEQLVGLTRSHIPPA